MLLPQGEHVMAMLFNIMTLDLLELKTMDFIYFYFISYFILFFIYFY